MEKRKEKEEFVPPDGGYGWVIVFANILINSSILTLVQCFGIIFKDEFSSMGISAARTSFLLHLNSSIYCSFGFFGSPLLKKYGFRIVAFVGASLMCFGIFLSSFANTYGFLIFSISILMGLGQGILMPATYLATYTYFKKRLTVAISISATGASVSAIFMPKLCDILLTQVGRQYTVLVLFAISLLSLVGCFLFKPIKTEDDSCKCTELLSMNDEKPMTNTDEKDEVRGNLITRNSNAVYKTTTIPVKKDTVIERLCNLFDLQLLKQVSYVLVVIGLGLSFAAELNVVLMMQFVLPELSDFSRTDVAHVTSTQFAFDIVGRLVVPLLAHHLCDAPPKIMYGGALITATIARTVLATWGKSYTLVYVCCSLIGLTKGIRAVFQSVIIPKYVPLDKIPAANGLNMLFTGAVSLIIGPVIGAIHDKTNSYVPALHTASAISCFCVMLWIFEHALLKEKSQIIEDVN